MKTIVAIFLMLHGLTHTILAMVPSPKTPNAGFATFFSGIGSWLLPGLSKPAGRTLATTLAVTATLGFVTAGLALLGVMPLGWWRALAVAAAGVSLLLVGLFWDRILIVGPVIDATILVVLLFFDWSPG